MRDTLKIEAHGCDARVSYKPIDMDQKGLIQEAMLDLAETRDLVKLLDDMILVLARGAQSVSSAGSQLEAFEGCVNALRGFVPMTFALIVREMPEGPPAIVWTDATTDAASLAPLVTAIAPFDANTPILISDHDPTSEPTAPTGPRAVCATQIPTTPRLALILCHESPGAYGPRTSAVVQRFVHLFEIASRASDAPAPAPFIPGLGFLEFDDQSRLVHTSPGANALLEALQLDVGALIPPELARLSRDGRAGSGPGLERVVNGRNLELRAFGDRKSKHTYVTTFDITERRNRERLSQLAQRRLLDVLRALPSAVLIVDTEGRVLTANPAYLSLFNIAGHDTSLSEKNLAELEHQEASIFEDSVSLPELRRELLATSQRGPASASLFTREGESVLVQTCLLQLSARSPARLWHYTKIPSSAGHGRPERETLDVISVLDQLPEAAVLFEDDAIIFANELALKFFGRSLDDVRATQFAGLFPRSARAVLRAQLETLEQTGATRFEAPLERHEDGRTFAEVSIRTARHGERPAAVAVIRDISRPKADSQRLANLSLIAEKAGVGTLIIDGAGRIEWANDAFTKLAGYDIQRIRGARLSELLRGPSTDPDVIEAITTAISRGREHLAEFLFHGGHQDPFWCSLNIAPVFDERKNISRFIAIQTDISARKTAELDMEEARSAAENASKSKSEFLANMSHEIRTPLNAIIGLTELSLQGELAPEQRSLLRSVQANSEALTSILRDVLDFSKIEAQHTQVLNRPFGIIDVVESVADALSIHAEAKSLELSCYCDPRIPAEVEGDPDHLRQVLMNLVGNAIKFTDEGDISLRAELATLTETRVQIDFLVEDTGVGIPADQREVIFEQFVQADRSTQRQFGGTGLGLCISKSLVELMGGTIEVDSEMGVGSTFMISLEFPIRQAATSLEHVPTQFRDLRIMISDHNPRSAAALRRILQTWGAQPFESTSQAEVHAAVSGERPVDLLIVDLSIYQAHLMRTRGRRGAPGPANACDVLVLCRSGELNSALLNDSEHRVPHITKPVRQESLRLTLAQILKLAHLSRPASSGAAAVEGAADGDSGSNAENTRALHVLLIEDNFDNRRLTIAMLERRNMTVDAYENGADAIEAFKRGNFDVVLTDLEMPGLDGIHVAKRIRTFEQETQKPRTPIIAVTAHALVTFQESCKQAGMDGFLTKPVRWPEMFSTLASLTGHRKRVLVVDDAADVRALIPKVLDTDSGYDVETCESGEQAIQRVQHEHYDVVLLDMLMPGLDGVQTLDAIKSTAPGLRVLAMTALGRRELERKTSRFDGIVSKPIQREELRAILQQQFARASAARTPSTSPEVRPSPHADDTASAHASTRRDGGSTRIVVQIDPDILNLIPSFLESRKQDVTTLRETLISGDLETARRIGHTLKGVGASYGFASITVFGQAIERAVIDGKLKVAREEIDQLESYLYAVVVEAAPSR